MQRRAIKIDRHFTPEWQKNKELPPNEQISIEFNRIPATSEKVTYQSFAYKNGAVEIIYNDNLLVATLVSKVNNWNLDDGSKVKDGKDLATLIDPDLPSLFTEIRDYLFPSNEELSEGESKA